MPARFTVVGLDLSLRATGLCVIDPSWAPGSWEGIGTATFGVSLSKDATDQQKIERLRAIKDFVLEHVPVDADACSHVVGVEQYAFTSMVTQAHSLGELGGVVKLALYSARNRLVAQPVPPATARKLLIGKGAGKGIKDEVVRQLKAAGAPFRTADEADAFCVANHVRALLGMPALTLARREAAA